MKILLGTRNRDKIVEIRAMMADVEGIEVLSLHEVPDIPEIEEDGDTIEANALKKALGIARATGYDTLSDDTGLFVDALGGAPGVYAARYAGEDCTYRDNRLKLLRELGDAENRNASFRTVVAFATPGGETFTAFGRVDGVITRQERGRGGFGYDAVFEVGETGQTFAEMNEDDKNRISHRARAFAAAKEPLRTVIAKQQNKK